jgi:hypothetical protein
VRETKRECLLRKIDRGEDLDLMRFVELPGNTVPHVAIVSV